MKPFNISMRGGASQEVGRIARLALRAVKAQGDDVQIRVMAWGRDAATGHPIAVAVGVHNED